VPFLDTRSRQQLEKTSAGYRWQDLVLIFPTTIGTIQGPADLLKKFKRLMKRANLDLVLFHDLRHTAASLMLNNNVAVLVVSKILGHTKPSTTLDIYGHLIPVMQEEAARIMDELVNPIPVEMGDFAETKPTSETY